MSNGPIRTLLDAAILAPSGDNMQPWRFEVCVEKGVITVFVDETRDQSPMNAGQRMARIACGAAVENIAQTAVHNGWEHSIKLHDEPLRVATIAFASELHGEGTIPTWITGRHTNRKPYQGRVLTTIEKAQLERSQQCENGIEIAWETERARIQELAQAIGRADAELLGQPRFLRAFLDNVRFDLPPNAPVDEGLSTGSLELNFFQRQLLQSLRKSPNWILHSSVIRRAFASHAERLVKSSSGICTVSSTKCGIRVDTQIGQVMQRTWLRLTELGYQVQPMMSMPILNADMSADDSIGRRSIRSACNWPKQPKPSSIRAILRFGMATQPRSRCSRRQQFLTIPAILAGNTKTNNLDAYALL